MDLDYYEPNVVPDNQDEELDEEDYNEFDQLMNEDENEYALTLEELNYYKCGLCLQ
jgi:hypothetical protein